MFYIFVYVNIDYKLECLCNCLVYAFLSNQCHSHKSLSQWVDYLIVSNNHIELIMVVVSLSLALRDFKSIFYHTLLAKRHHSLNLSRLMFLNPPLNILLIFYIEKLLFLALEFVVPSPHDKCRYVICLCWAVIDLPSDHQMF